MAGILTGIAWYERHEWPLLHSLAADPEALEPTYEEWRVAAEQTEAFLQEKGYKVERVPARVAELVKWCSAQGRPLDESARSLFVAETLRLRDTGLAAESPPRPPEPKKTEEPA